MSSEDPIAEHISYPVPVEEVETWRVINNMAIGHLVQLDDDGNETGETIGCIQMETCDVDGTNEMDVTFGLNPGAIETFVGSLCLNWTDDPVKAKVLYDQIWDLLNSAQ